MSLKKRPLVSSSFKASHLAVCLALALPVAASSAVLGDIHVISAYGQPFKAEIPLSNISSREDGKLTSGLGKPEDYQKAKAEFNAAYASLQFNVIKRGDQQFVEISSASPLNIPLYDLVVELRGGVQRQVRSYSFMMDSPQALDAATQDSAAKTEVSTPVVAGPVSSPVSGSVDGDASKASQDKQLAEQVVQGSAGAPAGQAVSSAPKPLSEAKSVSAQPVNAATKKSAVKKPLQGAKKEIKDKSFVVSKGDILSAVAQQMKPRNVSLNQMMIALLRANPDAFVDNNVNRLRSGVILKVPTAEQAASVDKSEANQMVVAQIKDFDRYRQALANHVGNTKAAKRKTSQQASGKVALQVKEEKNKEQPQDRLTLSKAGKSGGKTEERIAEAKALEDANDRVKALEKNVEDLQKLLALKNQALAEAQSSAEQKVADNKAVKKADADKGPTTWKGLANFFGSLNDIPHFFQIAMGALVALLALLLGLILNRVRKNKKQVPEEVADDTVVTGAAAGAAADLSDEDNITETDAADAKAPVDIAKKIDFDLNLDNAKAAQEAAAEPEAEPAAETAPVPEETAVTVAEATAAPEAEAPAVPEPEAVPAPAAEPEPVIADTPAADEPAPEAPVAAAEDDKLELDIPKATEDDGMPTPEQAKRDELAMKLDLASAYQEIGDNEGARELLEEIANSDSAEFAAQAKAKLAELQA